MAAPPKLVDFDQLWDYDDPEGTERKFHALLPAARPGTAYHVELLTQIARAQGLQRRFDEAHATLDEALSLLNDRLTRANIRYLLERGRVFNSSRHPDQARPHFQAAWEAASAAGEAFYAIDAAHMLAIVEAPEPQMHWHQRAIESAERSADPRARNWLGTLYNNLGWTYHDLGQFEAALETFQKALGWREEQQRAPEIRIAKWCVARALRSLGRVDEALALQQALQAEHERAGSRSGYVYEELGECLLSLNRPDEARPYFALAYGELSKDPWLVEAEPARIERLKELSGAK